MPFKLSNLNSNLALTLGYLNPALSNSALETLDFGPYLAVSSLEYEISQIIAELSLPFLNFLTIKLQIFSVVAENTLPKGN